MKRLFLGVGLALIATVMATGTVKPVAAQTDPNNFTIESFDADYYLSKDTEGRSRLKTVERITADFSSVDQNHGLERALPEQYDGHSTNLSIESVMNESGKRLDYSKSQSNDNLVLRIGNADTYVHGKQTYVITYSQRDVTRFFTDTSDDEFYWDVNGTEWAQAMGSVRARVHIPISLKDTLNGKASCYEGVAGSTARCSIEQQSASSETILSMAVQNLRPQENVTFAIGFKPSTFIGYQLSWQEKVWAVVIIIWLGTLVLGSIVAGVVCIRISLKYYKLMHRIKGRGTIIPEYLPPKDTSVLLSAQILGNSTSDITAQLIDLAVRHYLKLYQTKEKSLFQSAEYELEVIKDTSDLHPEEQRLLKDLFGDANLAIGSRFNMATLRKSYDISSKLMKGRKAVQKSAREQYGLYEYAQNEAHGFRKSGFILLVIGLVTFSPFVVVVAILAFIFSSLSWPPTQKGVDLRGYLQGLKLYISVAEEDRIKMLQSPEGAEKVGRQIDDTTSAQLVKLYERVLPYAVLFGIEKEWVKQLGVYYETAGQQPDWYAGNGVFNAVVFSSALHNFSALSSSYSSSSSSSSGGSGGGGSSGGGGGGGGGGGW